MREALSPEGSATTLIQGSSAAAAIFAIGLIAATFGLRRNSEEIDR
jgi:hypothetical protein